MQIRSSHLAAALLLAFSSAASADLLIGNLPNDLTGSQLGTIISGSEARSKAVSFTVPSGPGYYLDNARLVAQFTGNAATGGIPQLAIWSDAGGNPASQLFVLDNPAIMGARDFYTWNAGQQFTLAADTTYWLLVNGAPGNTGAFYWNSNSPNLTPMGPATFNRYAFSSSVTPPTANSTVFNNFEINATLIPAPGSAMLLAIGGLAALRRRR